MKAKDLSLHFHSYIVSTKRNKTRNTFITVTIHFDDYSINIIKFLALKRKVKFTSI